MADETDWAYDFDCDKPIEAILAIFNEAGPWVWQGRDSAWYGSYLNTRPADRVRVRVHRFEDQYCALLQLGADAPLTRAAVDEIFRTLLARIEVREPREIEPYD